MWSTQRATELLRQATDDSTADFRDGQLEAIRHVVEGNGRLLVVQRTGWGKSFVYFIACKMLREQGAGVVLLISPLLALMRNQIQAAERMRVRAATINSDNEDDWYNVESRLLNGEVDILLISPERLANEQFKAAVLDRIQNSISMLVIDEAHCISDWGHDFRPDYRRIAGMLRLLPSTTRILATTATANQRVEDDLHKILGPNLTVMRGSLNRSSLTLQTIPVTTDMQRLDWISNRLSTIDGSGIIYVLTKKQTLELAEKLRERGYNVEAYSSQTPEADRKRLEDMLLNNQIKALIATTALGMGFDKPDLSFVFHFNMPMSIVGYYQQVGRAGRALPSAYGVILYGTDELSTLDFFIKSAFPSKRDFERIEPVIRSSPQGLTREQIQQLSHVRYQSIDNVLNIISKEESSPFEKRGDTWHPTGRKLDPEYWDRVDRITKLRRAEIHQMLEYVKLPFGSHMQFLMSALGGDPGDVTAPLLPPLPADLVAPVVYRQTKQAESSDDDEDPRDITLFKPKAAWPYKVGFLKYDKYGKIPFEHRAQMGKAMLVLGRDAWSRHIEECRTKNASLSVDLAHECIQCIRQWQPSPPPTWVTCVPSMRYPEMVPDFARHIADELGLPFHMVLNRVIDRPEQRRMQERRKTERGTNLDGAFDINGKPIPKGNVLLIDDVVYSGWTMTIAAWLLRSHGAGRVHPFAIARKVEETSPGRVWYKRRF